MYDNLERVVFKLQVQLDRGHFNLSYCTWCWHKSPWSSGVCSAENWGALLGETRCAS